MAEATSLTTAWAVLGPIATAAASAWWSRRNQEKDRGYEHSLEMERLSRADTAREHDHQRAVRAERYNTIKEALADFMASSFEYVRKQSAWLSDPIAEKEQAASQANDKFSYSNQVVILLGDEELSSRAIDLWNATLVIPKPYNIPPDAAYEEKLVAYRAARAAFTEKARKYLRSLDAQEA